MKFNLLLLLLLLCATSILSQPSKVYYGKIEGDIDLGLAPYVKRIISEAEGELADAVIFKINTFGGRVDAATQIKDAILDSKINTIAFIDKRAISAGALIALSCEAIVMVPGASMGATTVVDQAGAKQAEKYQSYMRSEMRATAEKNGRRTDIAEAMVDERVVIEGLVDSTQLVTLTSEEAVNYEMADTILKSLDEVLSSYDLEDAIILEMDVHWSESVIRFINNPVITSILLMIGMVGLFTEVKSPGWGLPGTAAVIALSIFFGANYILELASIIEIVLFIAGVVLLLVEIFVVPGFGIFGILGIILMTAGLFLGLIADFPMVNWDMISMAIVQLAAAFVMTFILIYILTKTLPKSHVWNNLILSSNIEDVSGYTTSEDDISHLIGMSGEAITGLRPAGTALIQNKRFDVVSAGEFIEKGSHVKVIEVEGSKILVEPAEGDQ